MMMKRMPIAAVAIALTLAARLGADDAKTPEQLIAAAVPKLIALEEEGGAWPYEGVYRTGGEIPVGYRIGGTSIVALALLHAAPNDAKASAAIDRAVAFVLGALKHPAMAPSTREAYDVRVWGHACALELFCRVRAAKRSGAREAAIGASVKSLVAALITEEIDGGGWNYATRKEPATFVTAPVTQALLLARAQGEAVPTAVLDRARAALEAARDECGYFAYSGAVASERGAPAKKIPGAIARAPACEATLLLLGGGTTERVQRSLDAFHEHWLELEKRRKKTGTHEGPYAIAPYYFYFGHRYAAQAIELLPEKDRARERSRLLEAILRTRDEDGTWNDRVFNRSRNYGTAMIVLALLGEKQPAVPKLVR